MSARVVICCGSGGVGKTTISAAIALKWAAAGKRVAVLTIDPARRLADSLSIGEIGNTPREVPLATVAPSATGSLDAMMLDAKATFDDLIGRFAKDRASADRILANRYYQYASTRLGGSHEYMAMEKLLDLWQHGPYDVIVLDTPPTRHALDFLRAPDRMSTLMDEGVLSWLVMPATSSGWRALELGSEVVAGVLKRLLGRSTVGEIAEFFSVFRDLWHGFRERSVRVRELLGDPGTQFLLVSTPSPVARPESLFFLDILAERALPFGGFVINRTATPPRHAFDRSAMPTDDKLRPDQWEQVADGLERIVRYRTDMARVHAQAITALRASGPAESPCWVVPDQDADLHDLAGLLSLSEWLPDAPE